MAKIGREYLAPGGQIVTLHRLHTPRPGRHQVRDALGNVYDIDEHLLKKLYRRHGWISKLFRKGR